MVKRWNRLLVAFFVLTDSLFGMIAFVLAYVLRFDTGLIEAPKGYPPFTQYINVLPLIGVLVPLAFQVQGIYRLRRGRTRVDDFFAVLRRQHPHRRPRHRHHPLHPGLLRPRRR